MRPFARCAGFALLLFVLACPFLRSQEPAAAGPKKVKNVIFMIGDGMGVAHITLARMATVGPGGRLTMDSFPATGLVTPHSANFPVTDSAAAATALSSGYKTSNQTLGQTAEGEARVTIAELAHRKGLATGLVTTTSVTHATPAGFSSHVSHRSKDKDIAHQQAEAAEIDVLLGGGADVYKEKLRARMVEKGYAVCLDRDALLAAKGPRLLGIFAPEHMSFDVERDPKKEPSLAEMTQKAIEVLRAGKNGFFLMVEGGKIDFAAHSHDAPGIVFETRAFDAAVKVARDFAQDAGDTLVVVTADHSTAAPGITEYVDLEGLKKVTAAAETVAAQLVAKGGDVAEAVKKGFGVELGKEDLALLEAAIAAEKGGEKYATQTILGDRVSRKFGVTFIPPDVQAKQKSTHGHDGAMVVVFAFGPGAEAFVGVQDNTDLPKKMMRGLGWPVEELGVKR